MKGGDLSPNEQIRTLALSVSGMHEAALAFHAMFFSLTLPYFFFILFPFKSKGGESI
jgi:hypothetical protein